MAVIANKRYSTSQFLYNKTTKVLTAEISDLGQDPLCRVYDDSCDEGLVLVSHKTGKEVVFAIEKLNRASDHSIESMKLRPIPDSLKKVPEAQRIRILLFND